VQFPQFSSSGGKGEGPMDARVRAIPLLFPGRHFRRSQRLAVEPSVQALAMHEVDLRVGHVQPTAVLRSVMQFDLLQAPPRRCRRKRLGEACAVVGVQVVLSPANPRGLGAMPLHQLPDTGSLGPPSTAFYPLDMTPPPPWFAPDHLMADTLPLLCLSDPGCPPPARPLGRALLTEPLLARCLEAHH